MVVRNWRISVLLEAGDVAAVDQEIARVEHMANTLRQPRAMVFHPLHKAMRAVGEGRFDDAEQGIAESAEIGRRVRGSVSELASTATLIVIRLLQGRLFELEAPLGAMSSAQPGMVALRCAFTALLVQAERPAEARRELERLTADGLEGLPRDNTHLVMLALLADTAAELGDEQRSELLYGWLEPYSGRWVVSPSAAVLWPVDRSLGRLACVLGRTEEAKAHLTAARAQAERAGSRPSLALCDLDEARIAGDAEAAARAQAARRRARHAPRGGRGRPAAEGQAGARGGAGEADAGGGHRQPAARGRLLDPDRRRAHGAPQGRQGPAPPRPAAGQPRRGVPRARDHRAGTRVTAAKKQSRPRWRPRSCTTGGQAGVGALLDPQAKAAYRARLDDLQETIDEAEAMNDPERAAHARTEYEEIAHELAAATGLGGRDRPAASDAERARVNATRAIRKTLRRIEAHDARLGRQLARSIKTGTFCSYEPDPDHPISWQVETGP